MIKKEKLFEQFPPVSTREWMDKINADLKGADFNKKLVWKTSGGLEIMPFYRREDLESLKYLDSLPGDFPYLRGNRIENNHWRIRQNLVVTDYSAANKKALEILMKGIDSLGFFIQDPESISEKNFNLLLENISPEAVELNFLSDGRAKEIVDFFLKYLKKVNADPYRIYGAVETDPLSRLLLNGTLCIPVEKGFDYLADVAERTSVLPHYRAIHLNASNFGNAGADVTQELAFGISMGAEYISQLVERGIEADFAASKIRFSFGTGSDYFPEISKLKAARLLWSVVMNGFSQGKKDAAIMEIHCVTSRWNKTLYDPYINILRTQTEAMASILGGTDSLTVEPFDIVFREPDEFSERIARNQQLLLKEESYFDKVADPAAGSYYIEYLISLIANDAWKQFLEIEENGGFLESLKKGFIQGKIKESAARRNADISKRKINFLGTSLYPVHDELIPRGADPGKLFMKNEPAENIIVEPVRLFRGPEVFEKLRIAVEKTARQPVVFLFTIGNNIMRNARAQFISNFLGCAGYRIIENQGIETIEEGVRIALDSRADIVVICSSDEEYENIVPKINRKLKEKAMVIVAGNPPCIDTLKSQGIGYFISTRSDIVETLHFINTYLGIDMNY
jgi:methylmalonyl-CoA mutase